MSKGYKQSNGSKVKVHKSNVGIKERQFFETLKNIFIGALIEGESGYINLMRIKARYFEKVMIPHLQKEIEEALQPFPNFREELFDKLYTFFKRYFTESGSIGFFFTPYHQSVYERVYTDDRDVMLFWKTAKLYYVKTDRLFRSMQVEVDGFCFSFDVSTLEHKKANEKRELVFDFKERKSDGTFVFTVTYSEKGKKTKVDEIRRGIRDALGLKTYTDAVPSEETIERAFRLFERQSEVDYFICKDAKSFLREQFDLWMWQYLLGKPGDEPQTEWTETRLKQLQALKRIAYRVIDFIAAFEDELVKIWNKPKFVLRSGYVITLDRIYDRSRDLVEKIVTHSGFAKQVKEWQDLGIVDKTFTAEAIWETDHAGKRLNHHYRFLPIDTRYFKDLELEILSLFENLDEALDGWLIKSENYQALNTILPKFKERVQTIYIDPPFNTGTDFDYIDKFQDATWLTLMRDRLESAKSFLKSTGSIFVHTDYRANFMCRMLLNSIFGEDNFVNEIVYGYRIQGILQQGFPRKHDTIFFYAKDVSKLLFNPIRERIYYEKPFFDVNIDEKGRYYRDVFVRDVWDHDSTKPLISGAREYFDFRTQKSEGLVKRIIETTSNKGDFVMDFFLGIGTTTTVAHKLGRKWIGIEMGKHFWTFYCDGDRRKTGVLGRMKEVLAAKGNHEPCGISEEVNWQGGGFFKYYELEQYEDTLRRTRYLDDDLFTPPATEDPCQYLFLRDPKMLDALEVDLEEGKVKVDLSKLYDDIDLAETLSNLMGKWIKRICPDPEDPTKPGKVEFADGTEVDLKNLDWRLIKPLIWW